LILNPRKSRDCRKKGLEQRIKEGQFLSLDCPIESDNDISSLFNPDAKNRGILLIKKCSPPLRGGDEGEGDLMSPY